jgi:hypothetical protein
MPRLYVKSDIAKRVGVVPGYLYLYVLSDEFGVTEYWFTRMQPCFGGFMISYTGHMGILIKKDAIIQVFTRDLDKIPLAS